MTLMRHKKSYRHFLLLNKQKKIDFLNFETHLTP